VLVRTYCAVLGKNRYDQVAVTWGYKHSDIHAYIHIHIHLHIYIHMYTAVIYSPSHIQSAVRGRGGVAEAVGAFWPHWDSDNPTGHDRRW